MVPLGEEMLSSSVVRGVELEMQGYSIRADLIVLAMPEFDIILGMDWLAVNGALTDFHWRTVFINPVDGESFLFEETLRSRVPRIISCLHARNLYFSKGFQAFLASVISIPDTASQTIEEVEVVREFPDVFRDDVTGVPPAREVKFSTELMPSTVTISKAPHRLAPNENERAERSDLGVVRQGWQSETLY
ncbi:uncharacterized protein [Primulina huaijiensis]|uniref:uncharacterized protein n=1 Tax=Primulina huaijiensis TaxID=1492673 RepID=UPI003CC773AC